MSVVNALFVVSEVIVVSVVGAVGVSGAVGVVGVLSDVIVVGVVDKVLKWKLGGYRKENMHHSLTLNVLYVRYWTL